MKQSPSYVHFRVQWQLLGPESPGQRFPRDQFQKFWTDVNADPAAGDYDDFAYRPERCEMAKSREPAKIGADPSGGGQPFSKIVYANDQLTVVEEWTESSVEAFCRKLTAILTLWFRHFSTTAAVVQRSWLRALLQPASCPDAREFLGDRVLHLKEHFAGSLAQMPHQVGFTVGCVRQTANGVLTIDTRVNSWRDTRSVWVEVAGTTLLAQPLNATNVDRAEIQFAACKDFLEREVIGLLAKFDDKPG